MRIAISNLILSLIVSSSLAAGGCAGSKKKPANREQPAEWTVKMPAPTTTYSRQRPLGVQAKPTLVKQGPPPLVYLVEPSDSLVVSVADQTSGVTLARAPVNARTIVRVEAKNGVVIGTTRIAPGPLDASHAYGIYLEVDQASGVTHETIGPAERSKP
jgi:hypothetical protein